VVTGVTIAFFDVDETLVDTKSMFDFLRFHLAACGDDGSRYDEQAGALRRAAASGVPRSEINRAYYRLFTGAGWTDLRAAGERWYADLLTRPEPFLAEGLAALRFHQAAGHVVALVSGSFRVCLDPVAAHLGADVVLCTEPLLDAAGRLTGEVAVPMIGDHKRSAVLDLIAARGADPAACYGYGDHSSDLAFLAEVGNPTVIGGDPELTAVAEREGWPARPATTCAAPNHVSSQIR
jgi:HAD superfamily hydrolase (TIGR01490 family)